MEAMAAKIPVIATPVGGIVDFVFDDPSTGSTSSPQDSLRARTGYFCQPENPESIAKTVEKVISDPNKNRIVENAYKMVCEKYDWNLIAEQMKEVFKKIVL